MKDALIKLGLSDREADAYIALTAFKEATALQISKLTKEHRTNIYDSLDGLIKKGLVISVTKGGVKYYSIPSADKITDFIAEKESLAAQLIREVSVRLQDRQEKPFVEVYEGQVGFKSLLWKILREGKTIYGLGASEEWQKRFPIELSHYMRERERRKIRARLLYVRGTRTIASPLNEIRFLSAEFKSPSTIVIFGDYVATLMWTEPMLATLTKSKELSTSFRNYFTVLWKIAKEK